MKQLILLTTEEITLKQIAQLCRDGYDIIMHGNIVVVRKDV